MTALVKKEKIGYNCPDSVTMIVCSHRDQPYSNCLRWWVRERLENLERQVGARCCIGTPDSTTHLLPHWEKEAGQGGMHCCFWWGVPMGEGRAQDLGCPCSTDGADLNQQTTVNAHLYLLAKFQIHPVICKHIMPVLWCFQASITQHWCIPFLGSPSIWSVLVSSICTTCLLSSCWNMSSVLRPYLNELCIKIFGAQISHEFVLFKWIKWERSKYQFTSLKFWASVSCCVFIMQNIQNAKYVCRKHGSWGIRHDSFHS